MATERPTTRYTWTDDGAAIAYQVTDGDGPDIVLVPAGHSIDRMWEEPSYARVLERLARIGRLICLDYRGHGASDPLTRGDLPSPESWTDDTRVVLDAVGSTRAHLVAHGASGWIGILFAAMHPDRTETLTLVNTTARTAQDDGYPGHSGAEVDAFTTYASDSWGTGGVLALFAPSRRDEEYLAWSGRFERSEASPSTYREMLRWVVQVDVRAVVPAVRVPALVVQTRDCTIFGLEHSRWLAEHLPSATLVVLPGRDFWFFTEDPDGFVDPLEEFMTGVAPVPEADRALTTILFTDIVGSTDHAARLGDNEWRRVLDRHDALTDRELTRHRGRKVNPTGDGFLATFDGPARAVRCAAALCDGARALGIELRAGVHTGEVELRGADISGIAVHVGQRIASLAGRSEVLVSRTVTDLVVGSDLRFEDRGSTELRGVPGRWSVAALRRTPEPAT